MADKNLVIIRGAGDLATGVIQKFVHAGLRVLALEAEYPTAIRRTVTLSEAAYDGTTQVEDMLCRLVQSDDEVARCHKSGKIPLLIDPDGTAIERLQPGAVVDAIIAKRNMGTHMGMAPVTIGLGPGFAAGQDVHAVVETMRSHNLGRVMLQGSAQPNTGVPGEIGGQSELRVVHAPCAGYVQPLKNIGEIVHKGEALFLVDQQFVMATISGRLRGLIRPGRYVREGMKAADIDPRTDVDWHTISDKARCIGGGALEAYLMLSGRLHSKTKAAKT